MYFIVWKFYILFLLILIFSFICLGVIITFEIL